MNNVLILGASGDIGQAITKQLANEGYQLILHYNQSEMAMRNLLTTIAEEQVLQVVQADLTTEEGMKKLCQSCLFPVHDIVFVSGLAYNGLFLETKEKTMDQMLQLHVKSPWYISQYFLRDMIRAQEGNMIFITSIWGAVGASNEVIYSSVKGAQNSFVKALAKEVGPNNIYVNAISPGFIDTKMNHNLNDMEKEYIIADIPLNRAGLSDDVANAVSFLLSDKSNYIHGEIMNISGGWG